MKTFYRSYLPCVAYFVGAACLLVLEHPESAARPLEDAANTSAHVIALDFVRSVAVDLDTDDRLRG